jgi:hypothetical protein
MARCHVNYVQSVIAIMYVAHLAVASVCPRRCEIIAIKYGIACPSPHEIILTATPQCT